MNGAKVFTSALAVVEAGGSLSLLGDVGTIGEPFLVNPSLATNTAALPANLINLLKSGQLKSMWAAGANIIDVCEPMAADPKKEPLIAALLQAVFGG